MENLMNLQNSSTQNNSLTTQNIASLLADGQWSQLAKILGYVPCHLTIPHEVFETWGFPPTEHKTLEHVELLSATPGFRLLLAKTDTQPATQSDPDNWQSCRRIMLALHRKNPADVTLWWWINENSITVATVCPNANQQNASQPFIRRMVTDRYAPDPVGLQQWLQLSVQNLPAPDALDSLFALRRHLNDVLSQDRLTREFFHGFTRALNLLSESMLNGPDDPQLRHDICLATLLRLVFMYFLQSKNALDQDRNFIIRHARQIRAQQTRAQQTSFYQNFLKPLFFGALNRPITDRTPIVQQLGALPFLNGGLFEPLPAETQHPHLDWPPTVWQSVLDDLLERYYFTVETTENGDETRSIEPEMLGKVFEGLMFGDTRSQTGSFYTPRDVVRTMVESTLIEYLVDDAQISRSLAESIVHDRNSQFTPGITPNNTHTTDQNTETQRIKNSLSRVRILDPAVGTGAFLLETLHTLKRCWHNLGHAPTAENAYAFTRNLIHQHLFGVDITSTAVRLCELRLWLALLPFMQADSPEKMPPLPNLSHRIATGNALISPHDLVSLKAGSASWTAFPQTTKLRKARKSLANLQNQYLTAHGPQKLALQRQISTAHTRLHSEMLAARTDSIEKRLKPLQNLQNSHDLFGQPIKLTADQQTLLKTLEHEKSAVAHAIDDLQNNRSHALTFCFESSFGAAFDRDGFDIIITNPPWVRAHRIDRNLQKTLRNRYTCNDPTLWPGAAELGITNQFGAQTDLAALFIERSLELLRPGGRLCALIPVKLFRSLHGSRLRTLLNQHDLISIEDFSEADRSMFDATTYPAILHVRKSQPETPETTPQTTIRVWRKDQLTSWQTTPQNIWTIGQNPGEPWMLVEPEIRRIFDHMRQHSRPLGTVSETAPHRGILTGANDIFIKSTDQIRTILGPDPDNHLFNTWTRPVLCGREIRSENIQPTRRIFWPYDDQLTLQTDLPAPLRQYFEDHRQKLQTRSDFHQDSPIWQLFRTTNALQSPRVVWRDMSVELEAAVTPADCIPLNTVYFIPCTDTIRAHALMNLLNSEPIRAIAFAIAERARGGWRRHFAWVIRMLPIPETFIDCLLADLADNDSLPDLTNLTPEKTAELFGIDTTDLAKLHAWRHSLSSPTHTPNTSAKVA